MSAMANQRGFTLLEVLIAFALLAVGMTILLGILSGGLGEIGMSERRTQATLHARSLIDNLGKMERVVPGSKTGDVENGRYRWMMQISQVPDPSLPVEDEQAQAGAGQQQSGQSALAGQLEQPGVQLDAGVGAPVLYRIDLQLSWGNGSPSEQVTMAALRAVYPVNVGVGGSLAQ